MKLIIILFSASLPLLWAQNARALPTKQLVNTCEMIHNNEESERNTESSMYCNAYVLGIADSIQLYSDVLEVRPRQVCIPYPTVSLQLVEVFLKYIHDHPEIPDDENASVSVYAAFKHTYPCPLHKSAR